VLEVAAKSAVEPGDRASGLRLAGKGAGRWERSGGERAKFGSTVPEIVTALDDLRAETRLDCVRLLHFHIGSQLTAISVAQVAGARPPAVTCSWQKALSTAGVHRRGWSVWPSLRPGSKTSSESSMNYTMEEYAR